MNKPWRKDKLVKLRENQRKAKERKRLSGPKSVLDEELRWKYSLANGNA